MNCSRRRSLYIRRDERVFRFTGWNFSLSVELLVALVMMFFSCRIESLLNLISVTWDTMFTGAVSSGLVYANQANRCQMDRNSLQDAEVGKASLFRR